MKGVLLKMNTTMVQAPAIHTLNNLIYNNELVGYRIKIRGVAFDISLEDYKLINHDMRPQKVTRDDIKPTPIRLVERGTQLVPEGLSEAPELLYRDYARYVGVAHMQKTDTTLKEMYNKYNREVFNNELPTLVAVEWSSKLTVTAGVCKRRVIDGQLVNIIQLSISYHDKNPHELIDTLVHEMIHVKLPDNGHDRVFLAEADRINRQFNMNIGIYAEGDIDYKYLYECSVCSQKYERMRRLNTSKARCGVCRGTIILIFEN